MEAPWNSIQGASSPDLDKKPSINVEKSGKTMDIIGYNCEQYIVKNEGVANQKFGPLRLWGHFSPSAKWVKVKQLPKKHGKR